MDIWMKPMAGLLLRGKYLYFPAAVWLGSASQRHWFAKEESKAFCCFWTFSNSFHRSCQLFSSCITCTANALVWRINHFTEPFSKPLASTSKSHFNWTKTECTMSSFRRALLQKHSMKLQDAELAHRKIAFCCLTSAWITTTPSSVLRCIPDTGYQIQIRWECYPIWSLSKSWISLFQGSMAH